MSFILFYLLRRFFLKVEFSPDKITVIKGLGITVTSTVPLCEVVRVTVKRSLLLRLFRAKKVKIFCNNGNVSFFLKRDGDIPFLNATPTDMSRAKLSEELLGAFCDTHALGGIALLSFALIRISRLFGGEYSQRIINLLSDTSENFRNALSAIDIHLPYATVGAAVFAITAWGYGFIRKFLNLCGFKVGISGGFTVVQSGVITLYEHYLCHNSTAIREDGLLSLIVGYAPVRMRGVIVRLAEKRSKILPPTRLLWHTLWGHCKVPVVCAVIIGGALVTVNVLFPERSGELLKSVVTSGFAAALYSVAMCAVYIRHSGLALNGDTLHIAARHSLRLYTAKVPRKSISAVKISHNLLKRSRANISILNSERLRFKIRQIDLEQYPKWH